MFRSQKVALRVSSGRDARRGGRDRSRSRSRGQRDAPGGPMRDAVGFNVADRDANFRVI